MTRCIVFLANANAILLTVNNPRHRPISVPLGVIRTCVKLLLASLLSMSIIGNSLTNLGNKLKLVRLLVEVRVSSL